MVRIILAVTALIVGLGLAYWIHTGAPDYRSSSQDLKAASRAQTEKSMSGRNVTAGNVAISGKRLPADKIDAPATGLKRSNGTGLLGRSISDRPSRSQVRRRLPRSEQSSNLSGEDPVFSLNDILERFGGEQTLTRADIEFINNIPARFAAMGIDAVPAVLQFLKTKDDVKFDGNVAGTYGKYPTLRAAFIDALAEIGGDEAWEAMVEVMKQTSDSFEIRVLAKGLEDGLPEVYRQEINESAREVLNLALQGNVMEFPGLGHLLTVFKEYGDSTAADELEKAYIEGKYSHWKQYAIMTLSELPDGEGLPALVRITQQKPGETDPSAYMVAARMLAQEAVEYPEARDALVELLWSDKLDTRAVNHVAQSLGGNQIRLHLQPNGVLIKQANPQAPQTWTNLEIDERLALIDELIGASDRPDVVKALTAAAKRLQDWRNLEMYNGIRRGS